MEVYQRRGNQTIDQFFSISHFFLCWEIGICRVAQTKRQTTLFLHEYPITKLMNLIRGKQSIIYSKIVCFLKLTSRGMQYSQ